jgi:HAE1 family hydrophobic/amphiphilic exporter-1
VREKQEGQDLRSIVLHIAKEVQVLQDGRAFPLVPPPIQGIGNAGGFQMQVEQRDGSFDYVKLQAATDNVVEQATTQSGLANLVTTFRAGAPHVRVEIDRAKAETLKVSIGEVFTTLSSYLGSTFVNRFNKFGLSLQVFLQADSPYRTKPDDILRLQVRNADGQMVPIGALALLKQDQGPPLISLYNLYPSAAIVGAPAPGFSSGEAIDLMDQIAGRTLPPGTGYEWTAMSYQENVVGNQLLYVFALAILLVYLCLAGQYESWIAPLAVILAVPLALIGPAIALGSLGLANNLYTQIGLMLLIALGAKNAILIVEVAREARENEGKDIVEAAVEAARTRFRPILMTSFAFILGVVPLVTATGAGANSRISLGLAVFSGMIASTCLAVLFVPSFFTLLQHFEERRKKGKAAKTVAPSTP